MEIQLEDVAKKFNKEWIFRNVTHQLSHGDSTAIIGPNGSGKSTLLQLIAGSLLQTQGEIHYKYQDKNIAADKIYQSLSFVAPGLSLPEDFKLTEFIKFHFSFKNIKPGHDIYDLPSNFLLEGAKNKYIKNFSTGMKQRLKLGIALYADTPMLLFDEPATNLDSAGLDWYLEETSKVIGEKMIIVCSNRTDEYSFCKTYINILDYKN
jgi:ABC-type multidrug transport system ATPase subunit